MNAQYFGWLIIPLRVKDETKMKAFFKKDEQITIELNDLTIQAREMFSTEKAGICGIWRINEKTILEKLTGQFVDRTFSVKTDGSEREEDSFNLYTSWAFCFKSQIAFLCLGVCNQNPIVMTRISDFGSMHPKSIIMCQGKRVLFSKKLRSWTEREMGLVPFFDENGLHEESKNFFVDSCIYNICLVKDRFISLEQIKKAVINLHLGLKVDDPRTDDSEEDVRVVYGAKDFEQDAQCEPNKGEGSYRWGCCVSSQTMNYIYGGTDFHKSKDDNSIIDELLMEGLPLMIIALQQRYYCFILSERMNEFSTQKRKEREQLRDRITAFIAYGTLSSASISRWYNVKMIYSHLIKLMETEDAVSDITTKLNMLIKDADKHAQDVSEKTNRMIAIFGLIAIPVTMTDWIMRIISPEGGAQELHVLGVSFIASVFLFIFTIYDPVKWWRRISENRSISRKEKRRE